MTKRKLDILFYNLLLRNHFNLRPSYTYLDLFRTPNMRKITILISILYMLIALEFDTTVRNISNLNFNIYMSFMISGAIELPADLLSILEGAGHHLFLSLLVV